MSLEVLQEERAREKQATPMEKCSKKSENERGKERHTCGSAPRDSMHELCAFTTSTDRCVDKRTSQLLLLD